MRGAAFFDVDQTLVAGSTATLYLAYCRKVRPEPLRRRVRDALFTVYYAALYAANRLDIEAVMARSAATLAGRREDEFRAFCQGFVTDAVAPRVFPAARALVERHRAQGDEVALVSASLESIVEPLGRALGIEHTLATGLIAADGLLTGGFRRPACYGPGKVEHAERFCAERGLDLRASHFYTDSASDLPLLERVGHPRPVNADFLLRREAKRRGWPTLRFEAP